MLIDYDHLVVRPRASLILILRFINIISHGTYHSHHIYVLHAIFFLQCIIMH